MSNIENICNNFYINLKFDFQEVSADNFLSDYIQLSTYLNHLTPNGHYMGRTAQLTSRCCIIYIYSTNIHTEYFKHAE